MTIKEYIEGYTAGQPIPFSDVVAEVKELLVEIGKWDKSGMHEEFGDVVHFSQMWLYWRFGVNGKIWKWSECSVNKFMDRKRVWQEIYVYVGLDRNISNFAGNYKKVEKVIKQLGRFGIDQIRAEEAFRHVVVRELA